MRKTVAKESQFDRLTFQSNACPGPDGTPHWDIFQPNLLQVLHARRLRFYTSLTVLWLVTLLAHGTHLARESRQIHAVNITQESS